VAPKSRGLGKDDLVEYIGGKDMSNENKVTFAEMRNPYGDKNTIFVDKWSLCLNNKNTDDLFKIYCKDIVITDILSEEKLVSHVNPEDLLPGELSAITFNVGCYTVRSSQRMYIPQGKGYYNPKEEIPATKEEFDRYKSNSSLGVLEMGRLRETHEISAIHKSESDGVFTMKFIEVCRASYALDYSWTEDIICICTAKKRNFTDEHDRLFVKTRFMNSSSTSYRWVYLNTHGLVKHVY
jgi:hypothetical protein